MSELLSNITQAAQAMHWTEIWATIFGLIYIVLVVRENVWCWFWGILSCGLWAWATYNLYGYYVDAILNVFYVLMGFVGIYQWKFGSKEKKKLNISQLTVSQHVMIIIVGLLLTVLFGFIFEKFTPARATYLDSFTTAFAIFATFMTIQKKIDNWIYWIVVDVLYLYMYGMVGAYLFMLLYVIYCFIAVRGWWIWREEMKNAKT